MQHSQQDASFRFLWSYCSLHIRNVTLRKKGDDAYFSSEYDQSINSQKSVVISLLSSRYCPSTLWSVCRSSAVSTQLIRSTKAGREEEGSASVGCLLKAWLSGFCFYGCLLHFSYWNLQKGLAATFCPVELEFDIKFSTVVGTD